MFLRIRNRMAVVLVKKLALLMMAVVLVGTQTAWFAKEISAAPASEIGVIKKSVYSGHSGASLTSVAYNRGHFTSASGSYLYTTADGALWRYYSGSSWTKSTVGGTTGFVEARSGISEESPFYALKSNSEIWQWNLRENDVEKKLLTVKEQGFNAVSGIYLPASEGISYFVTGIYDEHSNDDTPPKAVVFASLNGTASEIELSETSLFTPNKIEVAGNRLVVIGEGSHAYVYSPQNANPWSKIALPEHANYVDIAGPGSGKPVVAVASDTNNLYYADSVEGPWHIVASPSGYKMKSIAYGDGYYIAVGESAAMFSKDGVNWSAFATLTPNELNSVEYIDYGEFAVIGDAGTRLDMQAPIGAFYSPNDYTFDPEAPVDFVGYLDLTYNMSFSNFTGIMNGDTLLEEDLDYTLDIDEDDDRYLITLKKEYLSKQQPGEITLDFLFNLGYPYPVKIMIKGPSTPITPTAADASKNSIATSTNNITAGNPVTLSVSGDRQLEPGVVIGDERYLPTSWSSSEEGKTGAFDRTGAFYVSTYTPAIPGVHTVTATYTKQLWDGSEWQNSETSDTKETKIMVTRTAMSADASNNLVNASPSTATLGSSIALTASGDRQDVEVLVRGDERYVPVGWTSTESDKSGTFTVNGESYTSTYTPVVVGSHTVTVAFTKQKWTSEGWEDVGQDTKTAYVTIGSGSSSGGGSTPSSPSTNDDSVFVLVNGKSENAGTATKSTRANQTVTTIHIDQKKLDDKLAAEGQGAIVTIPFSAKSDVVIGELNGQMIKNMENKQAVLEIKTNTATYTLPAQQINIDAISEQIGKAVALQDIKLHIEIAATKTDMVKVVENAAAKGSFSIVVPALDFTVTAVYGEKTVDVSKFNVYVERTIAIPDDVDPNKITTGVVVDPDGTVRHVPTKIVVLGGKYYAKVNSLTNSTYSIVWHPLEFSDMAKHWAKDAVNDMGSRMVIDGTGNGLFNPDQDITRAEFAAILVRGLGLKLESSAAPFSDVKATDWYGSAVSTAYAYDLISGFEDGTFRPMDKITREQAMAILSKAMGMTGLKAKLAAQSADAVLHSFEDASDVAVWAQSGVVDSVQAGIVNGRNSVSLVPKAYMTRAEVAATIQRLLQKSELI
ncbi:S-layer homology domain-containing protein [Paenibacillus sinopodophylli]|uniref:S-layer homology domain-containing protein n=1 Tax=Paenibacillus sinopodophylli TaxID=1837342 RepID=UPI0014871BB0|nr:S-layer homology domain-containing protein [Paenibacillus sinopodophylli]